MSNIGTSVGVDAAIALAEVTRRAVLVHNAFIKPLIFELCASSLDALPIQLAFSKPAYYKAVLSHQPVFALGTSIYTTCIDFHKFSCSQQMTNN
jgi:hypothetical protein